MASVNKVILLGNLGADPEVRYTQGGQAVASLRIATNEVWNDRDGNRQERTEWHSVTVWGKTAELCGQYLAKGRQVYVDGRLQSREYEDKEGVTRKVWEVVSDKVVFLGGGGEGGGGGRDAGQGGQGGGRAQGGGSGGGGFGRGSSQQGQGQPQRQGGGQSGGRGQGGNAWGQGGRSQAWGSPAPAGGGGKNGGGQGAGQGGGGQQGWGGGPDDQGATDDPIPF
ncbi:MAG: single-stranded DNA-binding protein [Rhodocyclaceae bacterium]|nr:MAG: single-stranded DNA-binding protein [Rhodocyclaceae bacterium]